MAIFVVSRFPGSEAVLQRHAFDAMSESGEITPSMPSEALEAQAASGGGRTAMALNTSWEPTAESPKPVAESIRRKLEDGLGREADITVIDDSGAHAGHAGARGVASPSGETHFKLKIVSDKFTGLNSVKRHRLIFQMLEHELAGPVHALSLDTKAPGEA
jgi:stress-induced morphogen